MTFPIEDAIQSTWDWTPVEASDLWCTYAAIRTLRWLDALPRAFELGLVSEETQRLLTGKQNRDGGFAWSRGMPSDVWATFYATQALDDLGSAARRPDDVPAWVEQCWTGEGFGMLPGAGPDLWATYYATSVLSRTSGDLSRYRPALQEWLSRHQLPDGGVAWNRGARHGQGDARAAYYAVNAAAAAGVQAADIWDVDALRTWIMSLQRNGGFRFSADATTPCAWATFRATGALRSIGGTTPEETPQFIDSLRVKTGFSRWTGYQRTDVWADFCAVGSLRHCDANSDVARVSDDVFQDISTMYVGETGGFTYTIPVEARNALDVSAVVLSHPQRRHRVEKKWLAGCLLPNEGGFMYMPGRGAEVRTTLWALLALSGDVDEPLKERLTSWLVSLQNPDGGFGYWSGRGSDLASTAAAIEMMQIMGCSATARLEYPVLPYVESVAEQTTLQLKDRLRGLRIRSQLDPRFRADERIKILLEDHRSRSAGYTATPSSKVPDLMTSYEAVQTARRFRIHHTVDRGDFVRAFTDGHLWRWSPLAPRDESRVLEALGSAVLNENESSPAGILVL